jgi:PAS domain S-box-containing protein
MSLETITNKINALICAISREGYFTYLNPHWSHVLGLPLTEIMAAPFIDYVHPQDRERTLKAYQQALNGEDIRAFRNRYRTFSGKYVCLEWFTTELDDGNFAASAHEVDDVVLIEEKLERHMVLLEQLSSSGKLGHWNINFDTKEIFWSKEIYSIHGVTPEEYTPELESAISFYHPDDIPKVNEYVNNALASEKGWNFTLRLVMSDGEIKIVRSLAEISRDSAGNPISVFGVFQDMTEYQELNKQVELLSQVTNTSNAGVVICDNERKVVRINKAFTLLTGYSINEVMGTKLGPLLQGPDTNEDTVRQIRRDLNIGKDISAEILNYHKNGSVYWNNLLISSIKNSEGNITNFIGIQNDISEKKRQEEIIIRHQRIDAIGQLSAGICHDFNNILGILSGNLELLTIENDDPGLDKFLSAMDTAILRASTITFRILKLTNKKIDISELFDVDSELLSAVEMLSETIPKNIKLTSSLNSGKAAFINKDCLIDSVINLIINSKHAIVHHGEIEVLTHNFKTFSLGDNVLISKPKEASSYILIKVRDTGHGISHENFSKIFDPFFSTKNNESGTGLGLSILAELLVNEGLGLTIQSHVGVGTTVNLWLPETTSEISIKQEDVLGCDSIKGLKIVCIDDEESLLNLLSEYLQNEGVIINCFSNPQEALRYISINHASIDLVITDNNMPGSTQGVDVHRYISQNHNDISCLVMTGYAGDVSSYAREEEVLQKPIKLAELKNTIFLILVKGQGKIVETSSDLN